MKAVDGVRSGRQPEVRVTLLTSNGEASGQLTAGEKGRTK